ncbi:MAG: hydrogenase maturation nickel metallochaperone HypA [Anaerolineae bacterium]|nr:hydrogenase maturation nickel metallochaperone HypA [Anaerolineae bacterium]
MHELAVTHSLLKIAVDHAEKAGAIRIKELHLVIGELSSIVDDSVQFYWDMVSEGTIAYGALLDFKRIPAALRCDDCEHEFPLDRERFTCPNCGSKRVNVARGDEFFLESIDVDFASDPQADSD